MPAPITAFIAKPATLWTTQTHVQVRTMSMSPVSFGPVSVGPISVYFTTINSFCSAGNVKSGVSIKVASNFSRCCICNNYVPINKILYHCISGGSEIQNSRL